MKNANPWAFGMFVIIFIVFVNVTDINWDLLFTRKKVKTKAYIIKTRIIPGMAGQGYNQYLNYIFINDNKIYKGYKRIDNRYRWQHIGNSVEIEYAKDSPNKNGVIKFNNEFNNSNHKSFSFLNREYSEQVTLINNIYFYTKESNNGNFKNEIKGFYKIKGDTIIAHQFLGEEKYKYLRKDNKLIDLKSLNVLTSSEY